MHLGKAVLSLAFATAVSAVVAAVPTDGGSVVVERPDLSPRDVRDPLPDAAFLKQEHRGSHSDSDVWVAFNEASNMARDAIQCIARAAGTSQGGDPLRHNEKDIEACLLGFIETSPKAKRDAKNGGNVVTEQQTVTAAPAGTTTVYVPPPASTPPPDDVVPGLPHELILTHTSDGTTIITTAIVQTTVVATVTTADDSAWTSASTLSDQQSQSSLVTLVDPTNPEVTSVITAGAPTTCVDNTSIDTHSYINISTFSASGLIVPTTTSSSSTSQTYPTTSSSSTSSPSPTSSSLSVDSSLMSRMSSEMAPYHSLASKTLTLGGEKPSTGTLPMNTATASASQNSSEALIVGGGNAPAKMVVGMAACLVLFFFL